MVIDFELNFSRKERLKYMEIIEFPIIIINLKLKKIVDYFRSFVKPTIH